MKTFIATTAAALALTATVATADTTDMTLNTGLLPATCSFGAASTGNANYDAATQRFMADTYATLEIFVRNMGLVRVSNDLAAGVLSDWTYQNAQTALPTKLVGENTPEVLAGNMVGAIGTMTLPPETEDNFVINVGGFGTLDPNATVMQNDTITTAFTATCVE